MWAGIRNAPGRALERDLQQVAGVEAEDRAAVRGEVADPPRALAVSAPARLEVGHEDQVVDLADPLVLLVDGCDLHLEQEAHRAAGRRRAGPARRLALELGRQPEEAGLGRHQLVPDLARPGRVGEIAGATTVMPLRWAHRASARGRSRGWWPARSGSGRAGRRRTAWRGLGGVALLYRSSLARNTGSGFDLVKVVASLPRRSAALGCLPELVRLGREPSEKPASPSGEMVEPAPTPEPWPKILRWIAVVATGPAVAFSLLRVDWGFLPDESPLLNLSLDLLVGELVASYKLTLAGLISLLVFRILFRPRRSGRVAAAAAPVLLLGARSERPTEAWSCTPRDTGMPAGCCLRSGFGHRDYSPP